MRTATTRRTRVVVGHWMRCCPSAVRLVGRWRRWLWLLMVVHSSLDGVFRLILSVQGFQPLSATLMNSASRNVQPTTSCRRLEQQIVFRHNEQRIPPRRFHCLWLGPDQQHEEHQQQQENDRDFSDSNTAEASLRSVTFCHLPQEQEPELLCDLLMELGACAAYLVDADRGTEWEEPLFRPISIPSSSSNEANTKNRPAAAVAHAPLPVWNRCNVTAHFPASVDLASTVELVRDCWKDSLPALPQVEQVPNRDWVVHVQQSWKPIVVAQHYVLRFPWHTDEEVEQVMATSSSSNSTETTTFNNNNRNNNWVQLQLQGGIAFGTGEHPTTQLCLEWLHGIVSERLRLMDDDDDDDDNGTQQHPTYTVLDYGAGSGILGMAACALDSARRRVRAVGVDVDVDACRIANANAVANGELPMRNYLPPLMVNSNETNVVVDYESQSLILKAHAYARKQQQQQQQQQQPQDRQQQLVDNQQEQHELILPDSVWTTQKYDCGVANILAGPLQSLAPTLAALLKPGAPLGLSGILHHQGPAVVLAYQQTGMFVDVEIADRRGDWVLVTARRSGDE